MTGNYIGKLLKYRNSIYIILFLIVAVGFPFAYSDQPLHVDEALYLTIGEKINQGIPLYKVVIDHKPPGVYYMAALISRYSAEPFLALRALTYGVTAVSGLLLLWLGSKLRDTLTGMVASLLFLVGVYLPHFDGYYFLTEQYAVLSTIIAAAFLLTGNGWWRYVATGIVLAIGVLFNQTVFLFGLAVIAFVILRFRLPGYRTRKRGVQTTTWILTIGISFAVTIGLVLSYFATTGQLEAMIRYSLYVPITQYGPPFVWRGHIYAALSYLPVWILAGMMVYRVGVNWYKKQVDETSIFLVVWFLFLLYPGATSFVGDHKMLFAFPPAAILAAILLRSFSYHDRFTFLINSWRGSRTQRSLLRSLPTLIITLTAIGLVVASVGFSAFYASQIASTTVTDQMDAANQLEAQIEGSVYIFPFRYDITYFSEKLVAPNTFIGLFYTEQQARRVINDLESDRVQYIIISEGHVGPDESVDYSGYFQGPNQLLEDYVNEEFERVGTAGNFVIYRRL